MNPKFEVQMSVKYMYDFMLYHNYSRLSGLFGAFVGAIGLLIGINNVLNGNVQESAIGFFVAILFFVITPISIKNTAKRQILSTPAFQNPLEYELIEEGVIVRQGEEEALTQWEEIDKAVNSNRSIILYITRVRAIILPKECMGEQYENVVRMISTHMPPKKVRIRQIH